MEFEVKQNLHDCDSCGLWYIGRTVNVYDSEYVWNDLTVKSFCSDAGYYATKAEAERYLMAYRVKGVRFGVYNAGGTKWWYITANEKHNRLRYVWRDLELHHFANIHDYCGGYFPSKHYAETVLAKFKEKHSMFKSEDKLVINVKLNGVDTPLHEISEQTLLRIRKASKPKPVPVFQVCNADNGPRLIFKVTEDIAKCVGRHIAVDQGGVVMSDGRDMSDMWCPHVYSNIRELRLEDV